MTRRLIGTAFALLSFSASAATCTYIGDSGEWSEPTNWEGEAVPKAGDTAIITGAAGGKTVNVSDPVSVARLETSGSGSVTLTGETITLASSTGYGRVEIGCALTVNNNIAITSKGGFGCKGAHGTFNGVITCDGDTLQIGGGSGADFNGTIVAPNATLMPIRNETAYNWTSGTINFNAAVTIKKFNSNNTYSLPTYRFNVAGNVWDSYEICYAKLVCGVENAMCATGVLSFFRYHASSTYDACHSFDLNGKDQIANRIVSTDAPARDYQRIISTGDQPTTLTLKGTDSASTYASVRNAISIVWDPVDAYTQTFQDREHPTTGSLTVKGGTLRVAGTSKFASVPEIFVGSGATFDLDVTTSGALASLTNLQIAANGSFTVGASATGVFNPGSVAVTMGEGAALQLVEDTVFLSLKVGEKEYSARSYEAGSIPGVTGGAVTVLTGGETTSTGVWIGGGESENTSEDANWEGGHPALQGLTFAAAGSRAVLNENLEATNVLFSTAQDNPSFTIASDPSKPNAKLGIGSGITVADPRDGVARQFTVEPGLSLLKEDVALAIDGAANALTLDGPIVSSLASVSLARTGAGTLYLNATNSAFTGPVTVSSGTNYIAGGALGSDGVNKATFKPTSATFVSFTGGVDGRRYYFDRGTSAPSLRVQFPSGATNRFNGALAFNTTSGIPLTFESGSETTFAGGLSLEYWCYLIELTQQRGSTICFVDSPLKGSTAPYGTGGLDEPIVQFVGKSVGAAGYTADPLFVMKSTGNDVKQGLGLYGRAYLRFDVDNAFTSTTPFYMMFDETGVSGRMDLNGHDQTFGSFLSRPSKASKRTHAQTAYCWIGSDAPATLRVYQTIAETAADVGWHPPFTGAVSLCKDGAETLTLAGYSTTTGRLEVAAGLLRFSPTDLQAGWTSASEYVVSGGTMQIDSVSRVRRKANWRLSAAGKLNIAEGVEIVAKYLWLTDAQGVTREAPAGVYTRANAPEYITGEGSVRCTGGGMVIILR